MWTCFSQNDTSKCENQETGISGYPCFKFKYPYNIEDPYYCNVFPEKAEEQKIYWRANTGLVKEAFSSSNSFNSASNFAIGEKDFYKKGEVVTLKNVTFSDEDKNIFRNKNTCSYQLLGRYYDNIKQYPDGYPNITDPNQCFNVDYFKELKGILNCGFAKVSYTIDNKTHIINSCLFSVGNKPSKEFQKFFKAIYFDKSDSGISIFSILIESIDMMSIINRNRKDFQFNKNQTLTRNRQLREREIQNYEVIIEDKNGKITKITKDSDEIQVINPGNQVDDDDYDEDFDIFGNNNSSILRLNIFILLLVIILNL
jgi:hypothetical protein